MKIKANELRIGNLVQHSGEWNYANHKSVFLWTERDWLGVNECTLLLVNVSPIPLTEEWLFKFGFVADRYNEKFYFTIDSAKYVVEKQSKFFFIGIEYEFNKIVYFSWRINFVHHLQNIIFSITGHELNNPNA